MDDDFDGHLERMKRSHMPASLPRYECRKCQDTGYVYVSDEGQDRKSTRLNSSHMRQSRMPSSA
jgi:hypothetical protein